MSSGINLLKQLYRLKKKIFGSKNQKEKVKQEIERIQKRKLFYKQFVQRGDLCFDVGANIGNRVSIFLDLDARVVAVEPQQSCYKILEEKFGDQIEIVRKGLGDHEDIKDFHISDVNTISSFSVEWINSVKQQRFKDHNWNEVVKIEMTTLDKLIEKYGIPAFIKIDVEGYEPEVLKGLSHPIKMISFEYTVPEELHKITGCVELIERNNKNIEWNYSAGENMHFKFDEWQQIANLKQYINTNEFIESAFGDIYVRLKV